MTASAPTSYEAAPPPGAGRTATVEMEAATLFGLGPELGSRSLACWWSASSSSRERRRIGDERLAGAVGRMGAAAVAALARLGEPLSEARGSAGPA